MDEVLYLKFTQHLDLQQELLATGDAELVEVRFPRVLLRYATAFLTFST